MFKYSSRFWLYAPITVFLIIAAATMIHWWTVAGAFDKKLAAAKGHLLTSATIGGLFARDY